MAKRCLLILLFMVFSEWDKLTVAQRNNWEDEAIYWLDEIVDRGIDKEKPGWERKLQTSVAVRMHKLKRFCHKEDEDESEDNDSDIDQVKKTKRKRDSKLSCKEQEEQQKVSSKRQKKDCEDSNEDSDEEDEDSDSSSTGNDEDIPDEPTKNLEEKKTGVNHPGELLFRSVLKAGGMKDDVIETLWNKRGAEAKENMRRCLRYFSEACVKRTVDPIKVTNYDEAATALQEALECLWREGQRSPRTIGEVKTAVSTLYGLRFRKDPKLSDDRVLCDMVHSYHIQRPAIHRQFYCITFFLIDTYKT
jgi:hypothetical protein